MSLVRRHVIHSIGNMYKAFTSIYHITYILDLLYELKIEAFSLLWMGNYRVMWI